MSNRPAWILSALATTGLGFAIWSSLAAAAPAAPPAVPLPPGPAFAVRIAGTGVVEPRGEALALGTDAAGLVQQVLVVPGQQVAAGAPLVRLDDRTAAARAASARAGLALARARLVRLEALPRAEELPPLVARVEAARVAWREAEDLHQRAVRMAPTGAVSEEDAARRATAALAAAARLQESEADLAQLKAGAWAPDLAIAKVEVTVAEAEVASAEVEVRRRMITAPRAATVLRVDARPGESANPGGPALVTLGDIEVLCVRADLDEQDAWRLKPGAVAVAVVRGNSSLRHPLTWDRAELVVRPKKSLTGEGTERIDTRVVQVLFTLPPGTALRVGQQVDVQVDASP